MKENQRTRAGLPTDLRATTGLEPGLLGPTPEPLWAPGRPRRKTFHAGWGRALGEGLFVRHGSRITFSRCSVARGQSEPLPRGPSTNVQHGVRQPPQGKSDACHGEKGCSPKVSSRREGMRLEAHWPPEENPCAGILQMLHCFPSSEGNGFGGRVFSDGNRIINMLCVQAEQKLLATPAEICFYRSLASPTFLICLDLITSAKQKPSQASLPNDTDIVPSWAESGGHGAWFFSHALVPTCKLSTRRGVSSQPRLPSLELIITPDTQNLVWPGSLRQSLVLRKMLEQEDPGSPLRTGEHGHGVKADAGPDTALPGGRTHSWCLKDFPGDLTSLRLRITSQMQAPNIKCSS